MAENKQYVSALDVGTSKVIALIGEVVADEINIVGMGLAESRGLKAGMVTNIDATAQAIHQAMSEAERMALSARGARAVTEVETWSNRAPLYVLATLYTPYTDAPLPAGEEVWAIDPYTEAGLVASLADAGLLDAWPVHEGQTWDGGAR